jgi:glycosyltransferase involved in cell wall biosynthesis
MGIYITFNQSIQLVSGVSIVVCTYNGRGAMQRLFSHFAALRIPVGLDWEIILTDNASTDGTVEWVEELVSVQDWRFNLKCICEEKPGLNHAREAGARAACHDWILFCDDDNLLRPDYLERWYEIVDSYPGLGAIGGQGVLGDDLVRPDWFDKYSHSYALGSQATSSGMLPQGSALYGAGLFIFKKPVLQWMDAGLQLMMSDRKGNSLASGGDLEWCYLLQLQGFRLYYDERLVFVHQIRQDRLIWSYYIKLKQGIASGVALLEPYRFLLLKGNSAISFLLHQTFKTLMAQVVWYNQKLKLKFMSVNRLSDESSLGIQILAEKASSYRRFYSTSISGFVNLKKILNAKV